MLTPMVWKKFIRFLMHTFFTFYIGAPLVLPIPMVFIQVRDMTAKRRHYMSVYMFCRDVNLAYAVKVYIIL